MMISSMFNFLNDNDYQLIDDHAVLSTKNTTAISEFVAPLPEYALLKFSGEDAESFLNNQLSTNVQTLDESHSQLSSYSSPKGMVYANGRLFKIGDAYLWKIHHSVVKTVLKRLSMFKLRDQVDITLCEDYLCMGAAATDDKALNALLNTTVATDTHAITHDNSILIARCHNAQTHVRAELLIPTEQANTWFHKDKAGNSEDYWQVQLSAGEACITHASYEQHVAQFLNWELLGGVDFKKGCYPGQEYIARTQYRGSARSRCYLLASHSANISSQIKEGDALLSGTLTAGQVINTIKHEQGCLVLAILKNKLATKPETLTLEGITNGQFTIQSLPYEIPSEDD